MQSDTKNGIWVLLALAALILVPVFVRPRSPAAAAPGREPRESLVILTPHNEATRFEFERAFVAAHRARTGRTVRLDWRTPGGTSEISRYLASEYLGAFQYCWEWTLHQPWTPQARAAFDNPKLAPGNGTPEARARKAFLESRVSCGADLLFGGGSFDFMQQAAAGRLVDCGVLAAHPERFGKPGPLSIPRMLGGEPLWDERGRWFGVALSAFGICYNTDVLSRLGFRTPPSQWADLADPRFLGTLALTDPTASGSAAKAFEMLVQQQIALAGGDPVVGWARAMRLIRRISANARYFTDSATKVPWDVESGDAAAGMAIDFYGRFESESVRRPNGTSRMGYVTPAGGSSTGADPIGMLRGAPSPELAREFIEFTLSVDGQKLWNWKTGTPGGPQQYALRRLPVLPELYAARFAQYRSDPEVDPFREWRQGGALVYHPEWTGALFRPLSFLVQTMCIDPEEELKEAWKALVAAKFPPAATARFDDVSAAGYGVAAKEIKAALASPNRMEQVRLGKELCDRFRAQYREVKYLAREGR